MAEQLDKTLTNFLEWLQDHSKNATGAYDKTEPKAGRRLARLDEQFSNEAEVDDFTPENLEQWLTRENIIKAWTDARPAEPTTEGPIDMHAIMAMAMQNDYVCAVHRDMALRYSSRIRRMSHESARRRGHGHNAGLIKGKINKAINDFVIQENIKEE